jgi:hypothetical protein
MLTIALSTRAARIRQRTAASAASVAGLTSGAADGVIDGGGANSGEGVQPGGATDGRGESPTNDTAPHIGAARRSLESGVAFLDQRQGFIMSGMSRVFEAPVFGLQFPAEQIAELAARFPETDDGRLEAVGSAVRARGHYTRPEFIEVCAWKTPRSRPRVAANTEAAVVDATGRALAASDEAVRFTALLELHGVGAPTASTLLYAAFPDQYPILDVRALESLGVEARSSYPLGFWLAYLEACRTLARRSGVSIRTLDKALWQHSKERS